MPLKQYSVPGKELNLRGRQALQAVSLNDLLNETVRKLTHSGIIVRCEDLPLVKGDPATLREFFTIISAFLLGGASAGLQLFLHLSCEGSGEEASGAIEKHCRLRFHTNVPAEADWRSRYQPELARCHEIISRHGGTFMVNNINNTGYVFSITLPVN